MKHLIRRFGSMTEIKKTVGQPKWYLPNSHPEEKLTQLKLYNSFTKTKTPFIPLKPNEISWYSCGPTVYDSSHMGHARNYVTIDINRRILQDYFGYNITFVQNVTDIDDKIIIRARQNFLFEEKFVKKYTEINEELNNFVLKSIVEYSNKNINVDTLDNLKNWLKTNLDLVALAIQNPKYPMYHKALQKALDTVNSKSTTFSEYLDNVKDIVVLTLDKEFGSTVNDPSIFRALPNYWEHQYDLDMKNLNVLPATVKTRVSEYVPEIISFVEKIIKNGYAYQTDDGSVYFNTAAFDLSDKHSYAKLQPWNKGSLSLIAEGEGSLTSSNTKLSPSDFALWKASKPGEPSWDSPWGKGRPGWHIECSVMASDILGSQMDIHSGGIDLAFPHHDNELAQSEAFYDNLQWVNYFLHTGHLHIEGQKMSKSLKNFITIQEALKKYSSRQLRLAFALISWNNQLDFKESLLHQVKAIETSLSKFFVNVRALNNDISQRIDSGEIISEKFGEKEKKLLKELEKSKEEVHEAFCDNLNTPQVIKIINDLLNISNNYISNNGDIVIRPILVITRYITKILSILGFEARSDMIGWKESTEGSSNDQDAIKLQFAQVISNIRDKIRQFGISAKNNELLALSDRIRDDDLLNLGISIDDRTEGKGLVKILSSAEQEQLIAQRNDKAAKLKEKEEKKLQMQKLKEQQELEKREKAKLKPEEMFQNKENYSKWDADGIPTADVSGEEISKSARKKLTKQWQAQKKLHEQYFG